MIQDELPAEHIVAPNRPSLPSFVTSLPDAVGCYDAAGVCQEVFIPAGFDSLQCAADLVGQPIETDPSLPAEAKRKLRRCLQQTLGTGKPQACRYDVYKHGRLFARDVRFSLLEGDLAGHVLAVFRDITEMRQTELALEAQNHHLRTLFNALPDGIMQINRAGVYVDVQLPKGFTPAVPHAHAVIGKTLEQVSPPEVAATLRHHLEKTLQTGNMQSFEYSLDTPHGQVFRRTQFIKLNEHAILGVISDITKERRTERQLARREQQLQSILDTLPDDIARYDKYGVCLEHKPGGYFQNFSPHAVTGHVGKHLGDITRPSVRATALSHFEQLLASGETQAFEYQLEQNGQTFYRKATLLLLSDPRGDNEVLTVIRDVTAEHQHLAAFERSNHRLKTLLDAMPDAFAVFDREGKYLEMKMPRHFSAITPVPDMTGLTVEEVLPADAAAIVRTTLEQAFLEGGLHVCHFVTFEDDTPYYREARFVCLNEHEVLGVLRDVTAQVRDQQALQASEQRLQAILSAIPDMIGRCDRDGKMLEIIHEGSFKRSRPGAAIVGKPLETLVSPERAEYVRQKLARALETHSTQIVEHHFVIDGEDRYREVRYVPLDDGTYLTLFRDNTKQKLSQQALITSQQRIQAILSAMPDMIARCDREGTMLEIIHEGSFKRSRSAASIVNKPLDEITSPERAKNIRQKLATTLDTGSMQVAERHYTIDGEDYYREVRYVPLKDDICLVLFRDITERKRNQLALAASEQQMRAIFSVLPDGIAYFDRNGVHQGNIHIGRFPVGVPLATVQNQPFTAWLAAEDAHRLQACLQAAFASGQAQTSHYTIDIDGMTYHRDIRFVYFNEDTCLGLIRDITEAHNAKRDLHAALEHSQVLLREVHHRVRNNLQMLSSLLQLHANTLEDENSKIALADNRRRIQTLALVHRVLYDNETYAEIALDDFLQAALNLFAADMRRLGVTLELHADPVTTNLDDAIPFGLIVNELVNNALEHAFSDGNTNEPRLQVSLQQHQRRVTLNVIDNGSGLNGTTPHSHGRLSMMIVDLLTDQLRGSINIATVDRVSNGGTAQGTQAVLEFQLS